MGRERIYEDFLNRQLMVLTKWMRKEKEKMNGSIVFSDYRSKDMMSDSGVPKD